jgi:DNA-binding protein H-NS
MATKSKSYENILKQIANLQAEAEKIRRNEVGDVIVRIKDAISHYGLTAADLGLSGAAKASPAPATGEPAKRRRRRKGGAGAASKAPAVVKYSNGAGGTWGGRGKRPQWLRDAINSGKQLSEFLVK